MEMEEMDNISSVSQETFFLCLNEIFSFLNEVNLEQISMEMTVNEWESLRLVHRCC